MGIQFIENREYATYVAQYNPRDLKDVVDFPFLPSGKKNMAYPPQATFVILNTSEYLVIVHVAMSENKRFYFGYGIYSPDGNAVSHPMPELGDKEGYESVYGCMEAAIKFCGQFSSHYGSPPESWIVKPCKDALREINKLRLHQMTIFDML